jgi:hypothetical protein
MRTYVFTLVFIVVIMVLGVRCTNPSSPNVPNTGGVLYGKVRAIDKYLNPDTNVAGIRVIVASSTWSDSTVTNQDGSWRLAHVPLGIFSVSVVKTRAEPSVLTGVQFVGSDSLSISTIYVKEPVASDFLSSAEVEVLYQYRYNPENHSQVVDSTQVAVASVSSKNRTNEAIWFNVTLNAADDCSTFIVSSGCTRLTTEGDVRKFDLTDLMNQLRAYYGTKDLTGKRLHLQIRRWPVTDRDGACHPPLVVPFNL